MSAERSTAMSASLVTVTGQSISFLISIVNLVVLSRLLTPADFGLIAVIAAIFGFAEMLRDLGLTVAAIREPELQHREASAIFWFSSALGLSLTLIGVALSGPLSEILGQPEIATVGPWLALNFFINGLMATLTILLIRSRRFTAISFTLVFSKIVALSSAVAIALVGGGVWALVALSLVASTSLLASRLVLVRFLPASPRHISALRKFMGLGSVVMVSTTADYVSSRSGAFVLGVIDSDFSAGVFSRVLDIVMLPLQIIFGPLTHVFVPTLAADEGLLRTRLRSIMVVLASVSSLAMGILFIAAPALVPLILGPQWTPGIVVAQILAVGVAFGATGLGLVWALQAIGRSSPLLTYVMITRLLTVAGVCVGVLAGLNGVALGFSMAAIVNWVITLFWYRGVTEVSVRRSLLETSLPLAAMGVAVAVVWGVHYASGMGDGISIRIGMVTALVVVFSSLLATSATYRSELTVQMARIFVAVGRRR